MGMKGLKKFFNVDYKLKSLVLKKLEVNRQGYHFGTFMWEVCGFFSGNKDPIY